MYFCIHSLSLFFKCSLLLFIIRLLRRSLSGVGVNSNVLVFVLISPIFYPFWSLSFFNFCRHFFVCLLFVISFAGGKSCTAAACPFRSFPMSPAGFWPAPVFSSFFSRFFSNSFPVLTSFSTFQTKINSRQTVRNRSLLYHRQVMALIISI